VFGYKLRVEEKKDKREIDPLVPRKMADSVLECPETKSEPTTTRIKAGRKSSSVRRAFKTYRFYGASRPDWISKFAM